MKGGFWVGYEWVMGYGSVMGYGLWVMAGLRVKGVLSYLF